MEVEEPVVEGRILRSFLRMRVTIDIRQPLATGLWAPRKDTNLVCIWLKYEKLQECYFQCGRIGYEARQCKEKKAMSLRNPRKPCYVPGLGVAVARLLEAIRREVEGWNQRKPAGDEGTTAHGIPCEKGASDQVGEWIKKNQSSLFQESFEGDFVRVGANSRSETVGSSFSSFIDS